MVSTHKHLALTEVPSLATIVSNSENTGRLFVHVREERRACEHISLQGVPLFIKAYSVYKQGSVEG